LDVHLYLYGEPQGFITFEDFHFQCVEISEYMRPRGDQPKRTCKLFYQSLLELAHQSDIELDVHVSTQEKLVKLSQRSRQYGLFPLAKLVRLKLDADVLSIQDISRMLWDIGASIDGELPTYLVLQDQDPVDSNTADEAAGAEDTARANLSVVSAEADGDTDTAETPVTSPFDGHVADGGAASSSPSKNKKKKAKAKAAAAASSGGGADNSENGGASFATPQKDANADSSDEEEQGSGVKSAIKVIISA
jgi:hypothetical protein